MKRLMPLAMGALMLPACLSLTVRAESLPPGQVDFGSFSPPTSGGEFVEVNLSSSLISLAASFVEKAEPDVAKLLKGLQLVRVNVIGVNDQNRTDMEKRVQHVRKELDSKGWERIVTAKKDAQDVGIYLKTQNKDTVQGVCVVVMEGNKQAVFVNVVGEIKPEQLSLLGEKLNIDPLKKAGKAAEKEE